MREAWILLRASYDTNTASRIDKPGWRKLNTQMQNQKSYNGM